MKPLKLKNGETIIKWKKIEGNTPSLDYYEGITEYGIKYGFVESDIIKESE